MRTSRAGTCGNRLAVAVVGWVSFAIGSAQALTINVNFEQYTPSLGTFETESELVGPAGGLGTEWNQYANEDSSGTMVDSSGAATTVQFTTDFSEGRSGGSGNTPMLRSTLTDFGRGATRTLNITGLVPGELYDIWLASFRDSTATNERTFGRWTANNTTASPTVQYIDNRVGRNGATFVRGYNYALFESVVADGSGAISFTGKGMTIADGYDNDYRLGLSGFQITPPRELLEITGVTRPAGTDEFALTWKSNPGDYYGLYWSTNLVDFVPDVHSAIPANASTNRTTFGPFASPVPDADPLFLCLGPPDLADPAVVRLGGNGHTITLEFSEALKTPAATNTANFSVHAEDVYWVITSAVRSSDGKTITLTTADPLAIATTYTVTMNNLTDLAGRLLGNPTTRTFQTWDNNPDGVKVFILAGQSNMVGHGKRNEGHDGVAGAIGSLRYLVVNNTNTYGHLLVDVSNPTTSAWVTRSDVQVWWRYDDPEDTNQVRSVAKGDLDAGFAEGRNPDWFGPEYAFGWEMGDHFTNDVLLIKTAWGGKSLAVDFRPPSAVAARGGVVGPYYTAMIDYVRDVLGKLGTEFPQWAGRGYQIAGFGWHQGWNDRISSTYSAQYEANLADLIGDLRAEFGRPNLPVSIGTTGMSPPASLTTVELAQLAVADPVQHPEFTGTVFTVNTRPFWRTADISPSTQDYHWNHNGESHFLVGEAMGQGMAGLLP